MKLQLAVLLVFLAATSYSYSVQKPQCSGPNEVYSSCSSPCVATCQNRQFANCGTDCVAGCVCKDGYLRDGASGLCVLPSDCFY